ncbi:Cytochrome c551 peroxidase precursor [Rubripirellula amarantea]|uniref:Cytochrome c551 peroxidase n=1 Tax=Rubripirellula amarantea TaxID=2527999 RepID=A0A5C5WEU8_9BACT|nr:cytochrome c peroxidase [Rubripirellula amarantea]TWT49308.1 Cytochrome c551 peroxidase precursor [Rubripirellula amarantea]
MIARTNMITRLFTFAAMLVGIGQVGAQNLVALPKAALKQSDTPEKIELGKKLYFDPRLSATGTVSCNSCHNLMEGGDDGRATSMGVNGLTGPRNAPTVWNAVFQASQFWDGRAVTLEEQAKGPMVADVEMGMLGHDQVISRIKDIAGYTNDFQIAFKNDDAVTIENAVEAIAAFERTLITPNSALDRYLDGDEHAMSETQIRGMELFESIGCTECHSGPALNGWDIGSDAEFVEFPRFDTSPFVQAYDLATDLGRSQATGDNTDDHLFKTPTLRNVTLTAPYLHNGRVSSLAETCRLMASTQLDVELTDREADDLTSFMSALEGEFPEMTFPRLPSRSGESVIQAKVGSAINDQS